MVVGSNPAAPTISDIASSAGWRSKGSAVARSFPGRGTQRRRRIRASVAPQRGKPIELAGPVKSLQFVNAAVLEGEPRTVKHIHDRRRDQDLARIRSAHDPSRCVDREPADVAGDLLDLSGVNACADDETKAWTASRMAAAPRTARSAPSNLASTPSPVVLTRWPRCRSIAIEAL